jgi:hypothetical protein
MDNSSEKKEFARGVSFHASESDFAEGLRAAVDYRGDCTVLLRDGSAVEGYIFNFTKLAVDLFPTGSEQARSVLISDIVEVIISGEDTAAGKSWEDWQKRKAAQVKNSSASH